MKTITDTVRLPATLSRWGMLLALLMTTGCADRTYLTKSHGRAYNEAFERQAVNPAPRPKKAREGEATEGLDSQEAAVIARSYRHSLAGAEAAGENGGQSMVMTNAGAAPPASYMPPPSVPNGQ